MPLNFRNPSFLSPRSLHQLLSGEWAQEELLTTHLVILRNCVKYLHASMPLLMLLLLPQIPSTSFSIWKNYLHLSNSSQMSAFLKKFLHLPPPITTNLSCCVNASLLLLRFSITCWISHIVALIPLSPTYTLSLARPEVFKVREWAWFIFVSQTSGTVFGIEELISNLYWMNK